MALTKKEKAEKIRKKAEADRQRKEAHAEKQRQSAKLGRLAGFRRMTITVPPGHQEEVTATFAKFRRKWAKAAARIADGPAN